LIRSSRVRSVLLIDSRLSSNFLLSTLLSFLRSNILGNLGIGAISKTIALISNLLLLFLICCSRLNRRDLTLGVLPTRFIWRKLR
jgi:hypothetical protein